MPVGPRPAPPVGTARVAISGTLFGHAFVTVFYVELTGGGAITQADVLTLAADIGAAWQTNILPYLTTDVTVTEVDVRFIPSAGSEIRAINTRSDAGTLAGSVPDASACHVFDHLISDYYRGGHPRWYLPGVEASAVTNGSNVDAVLQANLVSAVASFRAAVNALTTTNISAVVIGTVRFASGNAWLSPPRFVAFVGGKYGKRGRLGSQRRRILS